MRSDIVFAKHNRLRTLAERVRELQPKYHLCGEGVAYVSPDGELFCYKNPDGDAASLGDIKDIKRRKLHQILSEVAIGLYDPAANKYIKGAIRMLEGKCEIEQVGDE